MMADARSAMATRTRLHRATSSVMAFWYLSSLRLAEMTDDPTVPERPELKWCATHDCPALVYGDGSMGCWRSLVVEADDNDHTITITAAEARAVAAETALGVIAHTPGKSVLWYRQQARKALNRA